MDARLRERVQGRLNGKVALVTGGGAPETEDPVAFGHAIAAVLSAAGATVYVLDRDREAAERSVSRIAADGGNAVSLVADVTSRDQCAAAVEQLVAREGRIDVLVNNAAVLGESNTFDDPESSFRHTMEVNWMGAVRMSGLVIPHMGSEGSVLHIGSVSADHGFGMHGYSSSKGALLSLTYSMAVEHGPSGIRVNAVSPGTMMGPMGLRKMQDAGATDEQIAAEAARRISEVPLKRAGSGWDIALAVLYLAGEEAQWVTGQNLVVDAGWGRVATSPR